MDTVPGCVSRCIRLTLYNINTRACTVSVTASEMLGRFLDCVEVCVYCCVLVLPLLAVKACFEPSSTSQLAKCGTVVDVILDSNVCLCVCVSNQDWSIDLNRTLSRREKKKPSEGVTLTGISQSGSDQPVQPAKTSSR